MWVTADEIYMATNPYGRVNNLTMLLGFERDRATGELRLIQQLSRGGTDAAGSVVNQGGGSFNPRVTSDGRWLIVINRETRATWEHKEESGGRVYIYHIEQDSGLLSLAQTLGAGTAGRGVSDLELDDEDRLFVSNYFQQAINVFVQQADAP